MQRIDVAPLSGLCEPFSVLSHFFGALAFAILGWHLIHYGRGSRNRTLGLVVLAITTVQALLISSVYHAVAPGPWRDFLLRADVAGIFLLMAGCYTPVHLILFRRSWRWVPLTLAWGVGLTGAILKMTVAPGPPGIPGILIFLLYGWAGVITALKVVRRHGWKFTGPALLAGVSYTMGTIVLMLHGPTLLPGVIGPHELWHLAVLIGLSCHWTFVFQIAERASRHQRRLPHLSTLDSHATAVPSRRAACSPAR